MDLQLTDKIALITGSSKGLGLASARALVAEGCRVCICARGKERLGAAAQELVALSGDTYRVLAVQADLTNSAGVETVISSAIETFGGLDILVNSVGKAGGGGIIEATDDDWRDCL